jgi:hypothetical protein
MKDSACQIGNVDTSEGIGFASVAADLGKVWEGL